MLDAQVKSKWNKPVCVMFAQTGMQMVNGPYDALALLTDKWPDMRGMSFVRARSTCRAALDGRKTFEEARLQFERAVSEAQAHLN